MAPDLASPTFKADPYPCYARLREEAPVFPVTVRVPDRRRAWLVTRYDGVAPALKDPRLAKDRSNVVIVAVMRTLLLLAWTLLRTGRPFASPAPSQLLQRADAAEQPCSPVPAPATTHPAGT